MRLFLPYSKLFYTFVLSLGLLPGCTKAKVPPFELVPVSGVVTLDGTPLAGATVAYTCEVPQAAYYGGAAVTDDAGRYRLLSGPHPGALVGAYKVTVSRMAGKDGLPVQTQEGIDKEQLRLQGALTETIPPRYSDQQQTELKITVETGKADGYDLALKSG